MSHLQEENDTLWAKVKATGQAMNDTHASSRSRASQDQAAHEDLSRRLQEESDAHRATQTAHLSATQEAAQLAEKLAAKESETALLRSELNQLSRKASQEDEAKLKKDRRMLTTELLEVEAQLVEALNEREQVRKLLAGDQNVVLDKDYWAPALAMVRERGSMYDSQQSMSAEYQETVMQNRALASQVVDLENQLQQATSSLSTWNEAFRSGKLSASGGSGTT